MIKILGKYKDYKLCYVDRFTEGLAWFADCDPEGVWGDDFNDAPYEHNAGHPYSYRYKDGEKHDVDFIYIHYSGSYLTPAQHAQGNSRYSVEMINLKHVAWLTVDQWVSNPANYPPIFAGATTQEFCDTILKTGGMIYFRVNMLEFVEIVKNE